MKGLFSSIIALGYCLAVAALIYMAAAPAMSPNTASASVAAASATGQPS